MYFIFYIEYKVFYPCLALCVWLRQVMHLTHPPYSCPEAAHDTPSQSPRGVHVTPKNVCTSRFVKIAFNSVFLSFRPRDIQLGIPYSWKINVHQDKLKVDNKKSKIRNQCLGVACRHGLSCALDT